MGSDRFMEERDACPSRLAAANAKIAELERELAELRSDRIGDLVLAIAKQSLPTNCSELQSGMLLSFAGIIACRLELARRGESS
jgi:hypothetical protein